MSEEQRAIGRHPSMSEAERRKLILDAAEQVFAGHGYGAATMEEIATACGMAKKTLYRLFPDKMSVFTALVDSHDNPRLTWDDRNGEGLDETEQLRRLLMELSQFVLSPRQINLTRLVISEAHHTPELARRFYEDCIVKTRAFVAEQIARNPIVPSTRGIDPGAVADTFVGGTLGIVQIKALMLGMDAVAIQKELEERVTVTITVLAASGGR